jgi:hypothetical protein
MTDEQILSLVGWILALVLGGILYVAILLCADRLKDIRDLLRAQNERLVAASEPKRPDA